MIAVHARDLRYRYPSGGLALAGLDLVVPTGERVALLGPNGAGKTTFALHLNGLLRGSGRLEVSGLDASGGDVARLRQRVGLVFQDPDDQLFMPTVLEDVAFGPLNQGLDRTAARRRAVRALADVGMAAAVDRPPHALSLGERRRVAIAGVLACSPDLLVLDEPTANLDPRSRRELAELLAGLSQTLLLVTHDLPFAAELCPRAVIIQGGRVACDGPSRELLADADLLARHGLELPVGCDLDRIPLRLTAGPGVRAWV